MKAVFEFIFLLVLVACLGAVVYDDFEQRSLLAQSAEKSRAAAVADVNAQMTQCTAQVTSALKAGAAIGKMSAPRVRSDPKVQPLVTATDIQAAIQ